MVAKGTPTYDTKWGLYNLTTEFNQKQAGIINYKETQVYSDDNFTIKGQVNPGGFLTNGGDGLAMFFHTDDPSIKNKGAYGSGLGAAGYKDIFGFKVDTYYNPGIDTNVGIPYASMIKSTGADNKFKDVNEDGSTPQKVNLEQGKTESNGAKIGVMKDFEFIYDGKNKTLTVNYNDKTWKYSNPLQDGVPYTYSVSGATGPTKSNRNQVRFDSIEYSKNPYVKSEHNVKIAEVNEDDKFITGTGKPGDTVEIRRKDTNELIGTGKVGIDGNYVVDVGNNKLAEGESLSAQAITYNNGKPNYSDPDYTEVKGKEDENQKHTLTANGPIKEGQSIVTGTASSGDIVEIYNKENQLVGKAVIGGNSDPNNKDSAVDYSVPLYVYDKDNNRTEQVYVPKAGDKLTVKSSKSDGSDAHTNPVDVDVKYDENLHEPTINEAIVGSKVVKGQGVKGDKITIYDANDPKKVLG